MLFFHMKIPTSLFDIILFSRLLTGALAAKKVNFLREFLRIFIGNCVDLMGTNPTCPSIALLLMSPKSSSCIGMILDERWGCAVVTMFVRAAW